MKFVVHRCAVLLAAVALLLVSGIGHAAKVPDVRATKHNLSAAPDGAATPSGTVPVRSIKASSETQVCVFCHTPHGAENIPKVGGTPGAPLWNRKLSGATYTPYTSTSIEANAAELAAGPGGSSKLCLSCHDGTMAIDKVNVLNGASNPTIAMTINGVATTPATMPPGSGTSTGFTRNLGNNLTNDHPISFTYNAALATADGELRAPDGVVVGNRTPGAAKPLMPLENDQMQCATCHDPHLNDTLDAKAKFLRMNRLQAAQPIGAGFSQANDTVCLACHDKDKAGASWAYSAHANSTVATQVYKPAAATLREFPTGTQVWQAGCLNCHDTHTVQGARRLLREGTDSTASPKAGGEAAMEETCYQCHTTVGGSAVTYTINSANAIPDIKTDFALARRMPITSAAQAAGTEVHEIGGTFNDGADANCANSPIPSGQCGKDLLEARSKLGAINLNNRHAECTDCHNPHRVVKFRDFRGNPAGSISGTPDAAGTHPHTDTAMNHTNIASGVLRGSWGIEPSIYASESFHSLPTVFDVKRGDPGNSASALVSEKFVTREYQICLKCHSNYGYSDNNKYDGTGNRPVLGAPGTPSGTNGLTMYTNQAKEFQAPISHEGPLNSNTCIDQGTSAGANLNACNHRSWHPVMLKTGRNLTTRGITGTNSWLSPWNSQVGSNTMYCSDCHGSNTASATSVIPDGGDNSKPWGPHGSENDFLLKGAWTDATGGTSNLLCFKCHATAVYANSGDSGRRSGFYGGGKGNLHNYHRSRIGSIRCTWCHVAVPHGWKNKALLVNLSDVGPEAGLAVGTAISNAAIINTGYNKEPYYWKAMLKVKSFAQSGSWSAGNCGTNDSIKWMTANPDLSKNEGICNNPP